MLKDLYNARVLQHLKRFYLSSQTSQQGRPGCVKKLDSNQLSGVDMVGSVHRAHAAFTEVALYLVGANFFERIILHQSNYLGGLGFSLHRTRR